MIPPDSPDIARLLADMHPAEVARFNALLVQSECIDLRQGFGASLTNEHFRDPLHLDHATAEAFSRAFIDAYRAIPTSQRVASNTNNTPNPL